MEVTYEKNGEKEIFDVNNFYMDIAKKLKEETELPVDVLVTTSDGEVEYSIKKRSGSQFIVELSNSLPESYLDKDIKDRFLTCIKPEKNAYKFYKLSVIGNEVKASYGRMGVAKGELFGERSFMYNLSMFWIKYYEKIGKGYVDRSDVYLNSQKPDTNSHIAENKPRISKNTASYELYQKLYSFAKNAVKQAKISVPITKAIIEESHKLLEEMRNTENVEDFNTSLLNLMAILQRPVRTGDGRGVKDMMARNKDDFSKIILREKDLISAMEGSSQQIDNLPDFSYLGIEVYEANEKQKKQVMSHLNDSLKVKVKTIYRVIPQKQQSLFNEYLKKNDIKAVKQLWHGSRNQNWMSIVKNSLLLNPDAIITGKMYGNGIYFAPSSMKSWNYTSYRGTSWASGHSDTAFMGLYAVAYGKPYDVSTWNSMADYEKDVKKSKCNCLHAHAGVALRNDEIVFYNEAAVVLNYIVEFK